MRPPADGINTLDVPLGSDAYVRSFILAKFDAIEKSPRLAAAIKECRLSHNINRAAASACRTTHLIHLIPPKDASVLWHDFANRQSSWFQDMCDVHRSAVSRSQVQLPRALAGLGPCAVDEKATCTYAGSVIDSAWSEPMAGTTLHRRTPYTTV